MQPRLTRSRTDTMVAGVCGGLGAYFALDPVIVRLIFVLVTLTSGLGLPVYAVLWLIMPKDPIVIPGQQQFNPNSYARNIGQQISHEATQFGQHIGQEAAQFGRQMREVVGVRRPAEGQRYGQPPFPNQAPPPDPSMYNFDPKTGEPIAGRGTKTGQTIDLSGNPYQHMPLAQHQPQPNPQVQKQHNWKTLGMILIGIGVLVFLNELAIPLDFMFPLLMIGAGFFLLRRRP